MKYRYHKQYVREDYLHIKSPIFDLSKFKNLRTKGGNFLLQNLKEETEES